MLAQLELLRQSPRWTVSREQVKKLETDELLIGLRWQASDELVSIPMGFAPFGTMPVTRRAPYVCVATWPGGHENQHQHRRKTRAGVVDFLDARLPDPLTKEEFDALWDASTQRTDELLGELGDHASYYRSVAFRLSVDAARAATF